MKRAALFPILMVMIINIFSAYSDNEKVSENESTDEYEILMEPTIYTSRDEYISYMNTRISEKVEDEASEKIELNADDYSFYYEPEILPEGAVFNEIWVRENVYTIIFYYVGSDTDENTIICDWQYNVNEAGLEEFISDNNNVFTEMELNGQKVYYCETYASETDKTVIRRDFIQIVDGMSVHIALPGSISLDDAYQYLSVKKVFYADNIN